MFFNFWFKSNPLQLETPKIKATLQLTPMEQDPDSPPTIWFQPPNASARRRVPPIDPVVLIILFPVIALLFLFFFLPPFLSHTAHILKPASVKSTWDSLNIFLVLFAILCGVLARKNDDVSASADVADQGNGFVAQSQSSDSAPSSGQWIGSSNRKLVTGGLRRSSSSYPNLRPQAVWENGENQNRFFDDFDVDMNSSPVSRYYNNLSRRIERENFYRSTAVSGDIHRQPRCSEADRVLFGDVKEIVVDTFEVIPNVSEFQEQSRGTTTTPPPPPPPPPRAAPSSNSNRHSFQSVGKNVPIEAPRKIESDELDKLSSYPPPSPPPPAPPPPPLPMATKVSVHRLRHKHKKLERKVSDATKEIATAITSLYNQRKTKNKGKLKNITGSCDSSPPSVHSTRSPETEEPRQTLAPLPPPPPPPPPSKFHNLFKKGGKHKRIHSVPATTSPTVPPPPPPPPPSSIFNNIFKSGSKSKRFLLPSKAPLAPPPLPPSSIMNSLFKNGTKSKRFNSIKATPSPPPPPPPPPPMTPPRHTARVKSKQLSTSISPAQPPSPKSEPSNRRSTSKGKPPRPTKASSFLERDDFLPSGSQSPLIPMPPPPPPPFRVPAMKFELRGDFVRVRSTHSSVCSSPDRESVDLSSTIMDGGDSIGAVGPLFFPSPDVNAKADSFISRLKDEWKLDLEKINYVKEKMG